MAPELAASHGLWGSLAVGDPVLFGLQVLLVAGGGDRDTCLQKQALPLHLHILTDAPTGQGGGISSPFLEMCG